MAGQDAAGAQYAPTSVPSIGPPQHAQPHGLPVTGYDIAWPLAIGLVLVAVGMLVRPFIRKGSA